MNLACFNRNWVSIVLFGSCVSPQLTEALHRFSFGGLSAIICYFAQQFIDIAKKIEEECGHIDILVNNAGMMYYTHIHNFMQDDWDRMISVNCGGVTNSLGAVLPGMLKRGKGHIINMSSDAGKMVKFRYI